MNCPLCQSNQTVKVFSALNTHGRHFWDDKEHFDLKRCLDCEVIYISGLTINDEYYRKYYPPEYYNGDKTCAFLGHFLVMFSRRFFKSKEKLILRALNRRKNEKIHILDIGCGRGDFLNSLSDRFEKYGIEINPQGYEACLKQQVHVYNRDLKTLALNAGFFDCVTLWHVIEHLTEPVETLREIRRILKKDGVLVIATPNAGSLGFRLGKNLWFHLDSPRHLLLFGEKGIKLLLNKAGFKAVGRGNTFYDYPLDLFWSLRNSLFKFIVYPLYPVFKYLSHETLIVVCRKA